ncbi:hypothetical protein GCM10010191_78570 [Actinomadura vinacea]|uniref:DNA-directed DNA polymerase n=1 Tax=Actinomadura vinacea TaxID=115336 RepID=A0ABN3K7S1_9ACTN
MFFLIDDDQLASSIDPHAINAAITGSNPGLPAVRIAHHDLRTPRANLRLAQLIGLSDAEQVTDPGQTSSYPADLRPVCDTDPGFDQARHPYLAGYNSLNYDTTMFALYLSEVFADVVDHRIRVDLARVQLAQARDTGGSRRRRATRHHGAEADMALFAREQGAYVDHLDMLVAARDLFPHAKDFVAEAKRQHNLLAPPDGTAVDKRLVLLGSDPEKVKYRKPKKDDPEQATQLARAQEQVPDPADLMATQRPKDQELDVVLDDGRILHGKVVLARTTLTSAAYRDEPANKNPVLFPAQDPEGRRGEVDLSTKLHPKYARTSVGHVIHQDFTSYYPNLLRNMRAFWNPDLGEDRYTRIFFDKERYGKELKRPGTSEDEKARLTTLRAGTKLILNAASGAGDASHVIIPFHGCSAAGRPFAERARLW